MSKPEYVYVTYIRTTPEQLWQALTDPAFTKRYWNTSFATDWATGSPMVWDNQGIEIADPEQVVLESDPPRRLAYTWHTFTTELAESSHWDADLLAELAAEPRSRVAFDLEPVDQGVKLTVTHGGFPDGSTVLSLISGGWPAVISSLKTMLETGEPLA